MKISRLETTHLSTGQLLELTRIGNKYGVMLASTDMWTAPELYRDLTKDRAYEIFTDILREDTLS